MLQNANTATSKKKLSQKCDFGHLGQTFSSTKFSEASRRETKNKENRRLEAQNEHKAGCAVCLGGGMSTVNIAHIGSDTLK